jgi:uncharacterized phage protein (TIGR02220 family)
MQYLRVKNWEEFQHYKDRNPPWIKLHRTLLDDYEFSCLQDASKAHLILIWLFASQRDGLVPNQPKFLKMKLGLDKEPNLKWFIDHGLLIPEQHASEVLADGLQDAPLEEDIKLQRTKATENVRLKPDAIQVLEFLNQKTGRNYEPVDETLKPILACLKAGSTVEDCRAVVAKKCREWAGDPKMDPYLRPKTLFNATNFANYKGELGVPEPKPQVAMP